MVCQLPGLLDWFGASFGKSRQFSQGGFYRPQRKPRYVMSFFCREGRFESKRAASI
jgi:hypothetical protein